MLNKSEKGSQILERIGYDDRLDLEYGTPLGEIMYQRLRIMQVEEFSDLPDEALDAVEAEAKEGRFGAFVLRIMYLGNSTEPQNDTIEVWGWAAE